jgi:hypothetical protein
MCSGRPLAGPDLRSGATAPPPAPRTPTGTPGGTSRWSAGSPGAGGSGGRRRTSRLALPMRGNIPSRRHHDLWVVPKLADPCVAGIAEQPAHLAGHPVVVNAPVATAARLLGPADGAPATLLREHAVKVGCGDAVQRLQLNIPPVGPRPVINPAVFADREPRPMSHGTVALGAGPWRRCLAALLILTSPVPFLAVRRAELPVRTAPGRVRELLPAAQAGEHWHPLRTFSAPVVTRLALGREAVAAVRGPVEPGQRLRFTAQ